MARRLHFAFAAAALVHWAVAGAAPADTASRVVASIKPVHSLVSAVMAGVGEPCLIIRGGASPHTFSMRPSNASALADARVIFWIGEQLETSLVGPIGALAGNARVIALSEVPGLIRKPLREGGTFEAHTRGGDKDHDRHVVHEVDEHSLTGRAGFDMHIWLDPVNAGAMVRAIADTLSEADPANTASYMRNAQALAGRLDALIAEVTADLAPVRGKAFIVLHDAYQYFEDRFALTAAGAIVVSPDRSPGVRRVAQIRARVRAPDVACVFAEPQFKPRLVDVVMEGASARAGVVDPLGAAIEDGPELYFTLIRNMAASFKSCLAPADQSPGQ